MHMDNQTFQLLYFSSTYLGQNFNGSLDEPPLKFGYG